MELAGEDYRAFGIMDFDEPGSAFREFCRFYGLPEELFSLPGVPEEEYQDLQTEEENNYALYDNEGFGGFGRSAINDGFDERLDQPEVPAQPLRNNDLQPIVSHQDSIIPRVDAVGGELDFGDDDQVTLAPAEAVNDAERNENNLPAPEIQLPRTRRFNPKKRFLNGGEVLPKFDYKCTLQTWRGKGAKFNDVRGNPPFTPTGAPLSQMKWNLVYNRADSMIGKQCQNRPDLKMSLEDATYHRWFSRMKGTTRELAIALLIKENILDDHYHDHEEDR